MSNFEAPTTANKKHAQLVSFLKVGLVQGAELQAQVADLNTQVAAIQGALRALEEKPVAVPAQGRSQAAAPGVPASFMSEWYNRAANTMFWMPLYQVQSITTYSANPKAGASVVQVDELMKDSEDTERPWASIKTPPPPPGSSTVSALHGGSFSHLTFMPWRCLRLHARSGQPQRTKASRSAAQGSSGTSKTSSH